MGTRPFFASLIGLVTLLSGLFVQAAPGRHYEARGQVPPILRPTPCWYGFRSRKASLLSRSRCNG